MAGNCTNQDIDASADCDSCAEQHKQWQAKAAAQRHEAFNRSIACHLKSSRPQSGRKHADKCTIAKHEMMYKRRN